MWLDYQFWNYFSFRMVIYYFRSMPTASKNCVNLECRSKSRVYEVRAHYPTRFAVQVYINKHQHPALLTTFPHIQPDQIPASASVCYCTLWQSTLYGSVNGSSNNLQGTRNTRPCIAGHPVQFDAIRSRQFHIVDWFTEQFIKQSSYIEKHLRCASHCFPI